jgi:hypothetical protein
MTDIPEKSNPQEQTFKEFERLVSKHRFRRYRRETAGKHEAVSLYLWNIALSEALYPAFHFFEVTLRNATHQALSTHHGGNTRWFMDYTVLTQARHQQQVMDAIEELRKQGKKHFVGNIADTDFPKEPPRVVAALSLGFWVNLYSDPYVRSIMIPIADKVFANGPKEVVRDKRQDIIYPRLRDILELRNRVFHHEPIYHWTLPNARPSLMERYEKMCEVIGWMCPVQRTFLGEMDRFIKVHDAGRQPYLEATELAFLQEAERSEIQTIKHG